MKEKDVLGKVMKIPDDKIRDDDHLERPGLTEEEANIGFKQLFEKHKDDKIDKPTDEFAKGVIDSLNKDKSNY